ncbi:MAG: radical SAM protein [Alphaproteobacteria bacterium]|nr:radical SAM protein [Alphaproteobacteria bacterium]MCB9796357.1 radical SAM protein [Alphaproteobacteria bacterium]
MRVALVTRGDLFPTNHGAAVKIVRTAEYLSLLGATVCVVTDDRDHYQRFEGGRREAVPYSPRARAAQEWPGVRQGGRLAERLCARLGYPPEESFLYTAQFDPAWWARVMAVGRAEKIEVFQAEFPGYGLACHLAARALGGRSVICQHNVEWDRLQDVSGLSDEEVAWIRGLERFVLDRVDEVIAVSADDKARMAAAGVAAEKITVLPHGVDTRSYRGVSGAGLRAAYGLAQDAPLLFFHGTLHYWPNTQAVAFIAEQLLPRLLPHHPDLKVMIAGMNPPLYYRHPAILFPGPVDPLPAHIAAADLCLCPVPSGGGTRMKLLEYFAAGKACVSMTKGAEGIRYEAGRELAIADDAEAFAAEVLRLLADRAAREAMGAEARRFVSWYDWTPIAEATLALYAGRGRGGDYNLDVQARRAAGEAPPEALALEVGERDAIESHLPARAPSKPLTLLLLINRGCNLRCSFCDLWDRPENMPFERVLALLDEAQAIGTKILVITGGEPFMHPRLFDVVREAKARGMGVNITTNGTLVEKRWEELRAAGVDSLSISIDGLAETHDALRGQQGAHKRSLRALGRLAEAGGVGLSIYFTVTKENVRELIPVFELSRELGAGFDFWPVNDAEELYLVDEADITEYRRAVEHVAARDPEVASRRAFYEGGLAYHAGQMSGPVRCLGLVDQYGVTYEGALLPCCVWGADGIQVGNVFETPLSELWRSPEVQRHREGLYGEGCEAGCFNHSLYEFSRSTGEDFRVERGAQGRS